MRRKVASAKAGGMAEDSIALALGITRPTLQKHFMVELTTGAAVRKMEAMDALFAAAKKGNVTAIKAVVLIQAGFEPTPGKPPGEGAGAPAAPAPGPTARLGKKEVAAAAAVTAADGTEWADLLPRSGQVQ